jgi:phosphatidylethanolamine/phosphatidyl-N-methylethanolamine N-methyltransferase
VHSPLHHGFLDKLNQHREFYRAWANRPKMIGAIAPTSIALARKMASVIRPDGRLPILELGPGSGIITRSILERGIAPENLISVEFSKSFIPGLKNRYPGVRFVHGDAFNISQITRKFGIKKFDVIISALPLLNFSLLQRFRFIRLMLSFLEPGQPIVQFSYGPNAPVPSRSRHFDVAHLDTILWNLPPARLWTYRHRAEGVTPIESLCLDKL